MGKRRRAVLLSLCVSVLLLVAMPALALSARQDDEPACEDGWASLPSEEFPGKIRVWATCSGDYRTDLRQMLDIVEGFWGPMTTFMGIEPRPDAGTASAGGDTAIDFYLADQDTGVPQRGASAPGARTYGYARPAAPFVGVSSSSYIVMRREMLGDPQFVDTLAHEFFHVLQQARNSQLNFNWDIRPDDDPEWDTLVFAEPWWTEATAEWAAFYFTRDMRQQDDTRLVGHHGRFKYFLDHATDIPLHAPQQRGESGWGFMYSTYIWFYFMEQEIGPRAIAEIWEAFAGLGPHDTAGAMAIIDARFPFERHFRDFAVRNLNLELTPGDPIHPSYNDLDPAFPEGAMVSPPLRAGEEDEQAVLQMSANGDEPHRFADRLRSLTAHYYRFLPDSDGGHLILDFSNLGPAVDLDVDALVKIEHGAWEHHRLPTGGAATFCLSTPEADVEELYLILSNHNRDLFSVVEGEFTARVLAEPCPGDN